MTTLLTIIILTLILISLYQINKIFKISTRGQASKNSSIANDDDNKINGYLMFGFLLFLYIFMVYGFVEWGKVVLGKPASEHGVSFDYLLYFTFAIILIVQIVTQALLFYFGYKYRGNKEKKALHYADNDRLEFFWTIIPVVVLAGIIIYGLWNWNNIMSVDVDDDPMVVELYAQQFNWKVRYSGEDNVLGSANVRFLKDYEGKNILGIDSSDPNGMDDIVVTSALHLPVGKKILFQMRSQDVIHSAYFPEFRAQMNCVPGMITHFSFTPTITTEEMREDPDVIAKVKRTNLFRQERREKGEDLDSWQFDYSLLCNKICGAAHYKMKFKVIVETQEEFNSWIAKQLVFEDMMTASYK